jgi:hypothetical protein
MAITQYALEKLQHFTLLATTTITAVGDQSGVDLGGLEGDIQIILNATAAGSGATFDCRIEESDTEGGSYTAVTGGGFTQIGNAASKQVLTLNSDNLKRWIRFSVTAEGGTASSAITVNGYGMKKYD